MLDLALVSANFGGIDDVKPLPPRVGFDAFYYTDGETVATTSASTAESWTKIIIPDYPRHDFGSRLRARYFKLQIHRLPELRPYRWLAWADASISFKNFEFLQDNIRRLRRLPPRHRLLLVPHPDRETIAQEYEYIRDTIERGSEYLRIRYSQEKMKEQMQFFASEGFGLDAKLWCATIWMVENNDIINRCWDSWWDQNLRYGQMDQLSFPVALEEFGLSPQTLSINLWDNRYFDWVLHKNQLM